MTLFVGSSSYKYLRAAQTSNMLCQNQQSDALQVLAEQEAWKSAKQHGLDLVTILPNFVLGPVLSSRADGTSVGFLKVQTLPNLPRTASVQEVPTCCAFPNTAVMPIRSLEPWCVTSISV